jgi:hypothetical protein
VTPAELCATVRVVGVRVEVVHMYLRDRHKRRPKPRTL